MVKVFFAAFGLGLIFNAVPGAVFAQTVRVGARGGFRAALAVQIGSLTGDTLWAILGLAGVGLLLQVPWLRLPVGLAGAVYLGWLALDAWASANKEIDLGRGEPNVGIKAALRSGALISITNPSNVAYWAALGSALGAIGVADPAPRHYAIFFAGFMLSCVLWCFFMAAMVDRVFRRVGARWVRVTYRACAIAFLALAIASVRDLIRSEPAFSKSAPAAVSGKR